MEKEKDLISEDAIFNRKVTVRQRKRGYRFSVDALLLAWYTANLKGGKAAELGTGSGVVSLALAWHRKELVIDAVEIQESLFQLATENVAINSLKNVKVIHQDLKTFPDKKGTYDLVFTNPPFRAVGQGRLNPEQEKAIARHELHATLLDTLQCCFRCLKTDGKATMIILAEREADLQKAAQQAELNVIQKTWIKPFPHKEANLLLATLSKHGSPEHQDQEISIWEKKGEYTPLLQKILQGKWADISTIKKARPDSPA